MTKNLFRKVFSAHIILVIKDERNFHDNELDVHIYYYIRRIKFWLNMLNFRI